MAKTSHTQTGVKVENIQFGINDHRGREIGATIITFEAEFIALPDTASAYYTIEPGHYYALRVWATRNRYPYGAIQSIRFFKTKPERQTAISKYLKYARNRAGRL